MASLPMVAGMPGLGMMPGGPPGANPFGAPGFVPSDLSVSRAPSFGGLSGPFEPPMRGRSSSPAPSFGLPQFGAFAPPMRSLSPEQHLHGPPSSVFSAFSSPPGSSRVQPREPRASSRVRRAASPGADGARAQSPVKAATEKAKDTAPAKAAG